MPSSTASPWRLTRRPRCRRGRRHGEDPGPVRRTVCHPLPLLFQKASRRCLQHSLDASPESEHERATRTVSARSGRVPTDAGRLSGPTEAFLIREDKVHDGSAPWCIVGTNGSPHRNPRQPSLMLGVSFGRQPGQCEASHGPTCRRWLRMTMPGCTSRYPCRKPPVSRSPALAPGGCLPTSKQPAARRLRSGPSALQGRARAVLLQRWSWHWGGPVALRSRKSNSAKLLMLHLAELSARGTSPARTLLLHRSAHLVPAERQPELPAMHPPPACIEVRPS
mmetsp:Transcript_3565/g.8281  ORF Transcript_3565/g.8281 Transcript_3565/m.8281 type:complete len:279 (-) Transcript_3565:297-1133(-)